VVALDPKSYEHENENGSTEKESSTLLPAVLSIGYNPFYKNTVRSVVRRTGAPYPSMRHRYTPRVFDQYLKTLLTTPQEIHIMPPLTSPSPTAVAQPKFNRLPDFYGTNLKLLILGYIRPEYDYVSMDALIEDIRVDCEVARQSLLREAYRRYLVDDGKASEQVDADRKWLVTF
jgi:riboflavin kinase